MQITVGQITALIKQGIEIALLLIFAVTILQLFNVQIPMVPTLAPVSLLYVCGAWALLQGNVKLGR